MTLLVAGLLLFLGIHLVPAFPARRAAWRDRWGERRYKLGYSAIAAAGLALIVVGFALAPRVPLFAPRPAAIAAAPYAMALAAILFAASRLQGRLRRATGHPMLFGTILWSGAHLGANGDLAGTLLFGGFLAWALADLASAISRGTAKAFEPRIAHDAIAIVAGLAVFLAIGSLHRVLFGAPVLPFGF